MKNLFVQKSFDVCNCSSSSGQDEIRVHQYSFNKTCTYIYIFEKHIIYISFAYHKIRKYFLLYLTLVLAWVSHATILWHPYFTQTTVVETPTTPPTTGVQHQTHYVASKQVCPQGRPQYYVRTITVKLSKTLMYKSS